jgi:hypothetical protein
MSIHSLSVVRYQRLPNGVHEIVPTETTAKSVQQIFDVIDMIYAATPPGELVRYVLADYEGHGMLPINHVARLGRSWLQKNPNHHPTRSLFIYHSNVLLSTGISVMNILSRSSRSQWKWKFYDIKDLDAGMAWLLSDQ